MKTLNTLIRLHKRTLDELRRNMAALEGQKDKLHQSIKSLQNELEKEVKLAGMQAEMANFFGEFAKRIRGRQDMLHGEIKNIDVKIAELNKEIFGEFTELKKYEIARENLKQRMAEEEKRKETLMLDEIAAQQFQRRMTEGG
jgi:uncharacterized coiled-coil DUF342 family protein